MFTSQPFGSGTSESGVKESPASSAQHHVSLRLLVLCVSTDSLFYLEHTWYSVLVHVSRTQMVVDVCYSGYRSVVVQWLERLTADQQVPDSIPGGSHGLPS